MSKFCHHCGKAVTESMAFCGYCGTKLEKSQSIITPPIPPQPTINQNQSTFQQPTLNQPEFEQKVYDIPQNKNTKKKSKKSFLISIISVIVVVSIIITGVFLNPFKSQDADSGNSSNVPLNSEDITRTIMIYIVGSNLESQNGFASTDIEEMISAEYDLSKNNVLLCTGGARAWQNDIISEDETSYFLVGENDLTKVHTESSQNMGQISTLSDFLNYCVDNYTTHKYSLIFWDHGGGPLCGYGVDELSHDILELNEIAAALKKSPFNGTNKLELLGFDACLMNSIETAWIAKDYADYFVASQELEPGQGWNYTFLSRLNQCNNGGELGKEIIDSYFDYYNSLYSQYSYMETEITLSCLDLSKVGLVEKKLDNVFSSINKDVLAGSFATASRCRNSSKTFGKFGSNTSYDLVDLKHISTLLSSKYKQAADLVTAIDNMVVYNKSNTSNAGGVSIYHPYENMSLAPEWLRTFKSFDFADNYTNYLSNFISDMNNDSISTGYYSGFSKTMGTATTKNDEYDLSIQLTSEQNKTFSKAKYFVFYEMPADTTFSKEIEYLHIFSGQDMNVSKDGKITASYCGKAVFGKDLTTGEYTPIPLSMNQIYDGTLEEKYIFPCMFSKLDEDTFDLEPVDWLMKIKNNVPTLCGAYSYNTDPNDDTMFPNKNLVNSNDYNTYQFVNNSYTIGKDKNNNTQLIFTGSSYGFEFTKEKGFTLELRPIENKANYYAVFLIEDIYGNKYYSDFISLS